MAEQTSLSAVLKRFRMAAGLSQEMLAARASLSVRAISDLERGLHRTARVGTLDLLASALALSTQQRADLLAAARPDLDDPSTRISFTQRLPTPPTALLGRARERRQAQAALSGSRTRLLTLSGPSGVGKTRLALQIAEDLASDFRDGVVFVDLASMHDASLLLDAIAQTLGLREQSPTLSSVSPGVLALTHLEEKRMLLVLDNFEHVLDAAPLVAELLARCPPVSVLVTSRALLRLRGEQRILLQPLSPDAAVALFCARARAMQPDRELPRDVVAAICERVDALPLAIELAAGQTRVLPLPQWLDHLTHRLTLLRSGTREAPARQQTMEAAIAWSYELLSDDQQRCFRALGVFVGSWTPEAAQAVCWADDAPDALAALLSLTELADASIIQAQETAGGTVRFRMLELLREYALEGLRSAEEEPECRRRHAQYFAQVAERIARFGPTLPTQERGAEPGADLPNARAALEWAEHAGEAEIGLRLAGFARLWHVVGQLREAITWQERMLALDNRVRAQAGQAAPLALRVERLYSLARTLLGCGEYERAERIAEESLQLAQHTENEHAVSEAFLTLGMIAQARGHLEVAASAFAASYERTTPDDQTGQRYRALSKVAETTALQGDLSGAMTLLERALAGADASGNAWDVAHMATLLGRLACQRQRLTLATRYYQRALALYREFASPSFSAWCLEGYAAVLSGEGRQGQATRLCAAALALRELARAPAPPAEREAVELLLANARTSLGELLFSKARRAGAALTHDAALAAALADCAQRLSPESEPN